ncbi:hypothetical protein FE249_00720 [Acidiphilium multivorum]|uniref:DUF4376 domain-containing protein n=1 Tax=Acidiphilium multivorum TaxID=62140 RepID=UPI001F4C0255|nr:hypothetical protein [Acidiphilium multivorum]UNC12853.1 hypothetical protein FE249_00720 [Acidiphilium multivorum]
MLTMVSYSKPAWANAAQTVIDAQVVFKELGTAAVPFTASKDDVEAHGVTVFDAIVAAAATVPIGAYTPPQVSLGQQASAAMFGTVQLTSDATPALNATYEIDAESQGDLQAEVLAYETNGQFLDGQTTIQWPDTAGALHTFTAAQFKAFATAIGAYVGLLKSIRRTNALPTGMTSFPAATVTIA